MSEPDASLQQEILSALGNGTETTLLVLEMLSDLEVGPVLEEAAVVQELVNMEAAGLVFRRTEPGSGKPEPVAHGNIPEYKEGRAEVVWWELADAGRVLLQEEISRRGW